MSGNVVINGRTAVHSGSGGTLKTDDVCKHRCTGCCAETYPNVAKSGDVADGASTVFVNGNPVAHAKSNFAKSTGDEAGKCGGTQSGTVQQKAEFLESSPNVMIEGQTAVRQGDQMVSNLRNTPPAPLNQPGAGIPPNLDAEEAKPAEKAVGPDDLAFELGGGSMYLLKGRLRLQGPTKEGEDPESHRWELPLAVTDEVESQRRVIRFKQLPKESMRVALVVNDHQQGEYLIPLGRDLPTVKADTHKPQWEHILLPVVPLRYTTADPGEKQNREAAQALRKDGYVYIFLDGHLWRELKVTPNHNFCDVNLTVYQGQDERPAQIEYDTRIVLPLQINGKKPKIEMAYSEVQWSWARIDALGGMAKDDPRRTVAVSKTADDSVRAKRMQVIDLIPYPNTGFIMSGPVGRVADSPNVPTLKLHATSGIAIVYLNDALGIADRLTRELEASWGELKDLVASLATGVKQTPGQQTVPDEKMSAQERELRGYIRSQHRVANLVYQVAFGTDDGKDRFAEYLNKGLLRSLLAVDERAALRKAIRERTVNLLACVKGDEYEGALGDYLNNTPRRVLEGKRVSAYHARWLSRGPNALDAHLDLREDRKDAGRVPGAEAYLLGLLQGKGAGGKLLDAVVSVNGNPDTWTKWGESFYSLVDMFSDIPGVDTKYLPVLAQKLSSVVGEGIPTISVEQVAYSLTPPKGYRPVRGALRTEIVEYAGTQEIRTVSDSAAARTVLARAQQPAASGLSQVQATARNLIVLPGQQEVLLERKFAQLVAKERPLAAKASVAVRERWFNRGFMGGLVAIDVFNSIMATTQLLKEGASFENVVNWAGAVTGAADTASNLAKFQAKALGNNAAEGVAEVTGRVFGSVAWFATGVLCAVKASGKYDEQDLDAMAAYACASMAAFWAAGATAIGASAAFVVPAIVIFIAFSVLAIYLEDDPFERFVKNGPFASRAPVPGGDVLTRIKAAASNPYVGDSFRKAWPNWSVMGAEIWDYMFGFEIKVFVEQARSQASSIFAQVYTAKRVKVVLQLRGFQRARSQLELAPLRVYPRGIGGAYNTLEPVQIDYSTDDKTGGVVGLHLTYDLSSMNIEQSEAECLFFTRIDLEPGSDGFVPQAKGEARFMAARELLTTVVYPMAADANVAGALVYGQNRRVGTLSEIALKQWWKS